jgi:apurinic endonuclease APN1
LADNEKTGDMSKKTLIAELNLQPKMQIQGSVVHLGSFKKNKKKLEQASLFELNQEEINMYQILLDNINYVLKKTPKNSCILIENAGMRKIGQTIEEIAYIVKNLNNDRIKVCLDTCHLHAAGYNLTSKKDFEQFFQEFDKKIGLKKLALIHLNDSKDPFGSLKDHHENIGQGNVGMDVFKNLVNHKMTKNIPFILETPGFDNKGPDQGNIDIIKSLVHN